MSKPDFRGSLPVGGILPLAALTLGARGSHVAQCGRRMVQFVGPPDASRVHGLNHGH